MALSQGLDASKLSKKCKELGIKVGFVTTTTPKTINIIKEGLSNFLDFEDFDLITSNQKVTLDKPNPEVYDICSKRIRNFRK